MVVLLYIVFIISLTQDGCESAKKDSRGPLFRNEPPPRIEFSNNSGTELRCNADGIPTPKITWQTRDGVPAHDIPGVRHIRTDGTLVFPPFSKSDYRQDVHDTVYQCSATNSVGSILSRESHVRGGKSGNTFLNKVLKQRFNPQVYDEFVVRGNTAVLKCHLPPFVKEYVVVDSWIRNDDHIMKMTENKVRSYTVLRSGELLIHETQEKDSTWSYRCQTRHRLTGEMVTSASYGKIIVTEPHASTLPRVTFHQTQVRTEEGATAQLPCVAQGSPPPTYRWMKDVNGILAPVKEDGRVWVHQGVLNIKKVVRTDAGKYQCIVRNSIGERRIESALIVTAAISVHVRPPHQVLNIEQDATFNCNVSGYPIHTIAWKKDMRPLAASSRVRLLSRDVLHITSVRREDRGMYQCFVYNDLDSAQGSTELKISDVAPSLLTVFPDHTGHSAESVSFKCISSGNPLPQVTWYLDDVVVTQSSRISAGDYVSELGHVVSFLNISETRVEDSGEYKCHVSNDVGSVSHEGRLNIYGQPFVRQMSNVTAIAGEDLVIRCPYGGYPVKGVRWLKGGILLPLNHRQKINHGGSLTIQTIERLADEGEYSCVVRDPDGHTASSSTHISVVVPPVIESHFFRESAIADEGSRTKLMCVVTKGDPPLRFQWLKNGLPFLAHGDTTVQTFEDSSIVTFKRIASGDRGHYTCVASNMASSTNLTMQLIVNVPPQWTVEPKNASVVLGNTVWMDCAAVGYPAPNILWKKMIYTENTAGEFTYVHSNPRAHRYNNGTLVLSDVEENDSGAYLCQASNGIGAGLSKIITLHVLVPPRFKDPFKSKTVSEGTDVALRCTAVGDAPITIRWLKNKSLLDSEKEIRYFIEDTSSKSETSSELRISSALRNDTGSYACSALSDIGADEAVIKLLVQGVPVAPTNVTITNVTSRSISLQWDVLDNGNAYITGSIVQYQTHSDTQWNGQTSQLIVSSAESSATLRGLTPVTLYYIRVIAENVLGQSDPSDVSEITTEEEAPSGAPTDVQVHSTGAQSMKVTWKPPLEATRHGVIRGYYVGYKVSETEEFYTFKQVQRSSSSDKEATYITGLQPFTQYDIVVKAFNSAGTGPQSIKITGKTLETAPPTSPLVKVISTTSSTMELKWEKNIKSKSAVTEYTLQYKTDDGDYIQRHVGNEEDHYILEGLRCGTRYHLIMTASNSLGTGEPSASVTARTQGAAPMSPAESSFIIPNKTSVTLVLSAWQSGGCPIRHFIVKYRPKYENQWITIAETLKMPRDVFVLRHLEPEKEYVVMVTAHNDAGITQAEYSFRTLASYNIDPTSSPAFGKRETDLPFYKNVSLVIPVVVSALVFVIVAFMVVICLRKHSDEPGDRLDDENRKDSLVMSSLNKQMNFKAKPSHYSCPGVEKKGEYAEPYACIDSLSTQQTSDGLFATIKRYPSRHTYMSGSCKQGIPPNPNSAVTCQSDGGIPIKKLPGQEETLSSGALSHKWNNSSQKDIDRKPSR